jgi:hypothetical protein
MLRSEAGDGSGLPPQAASASTAIANAAATLAKTSLTALPGSLWTDP